MTAGQRQQLFVFPETRERVWTQSHHSPWAVCLLPSRPSGSRWWLIIYLEGGHTWSRVTVLTGGAFRDHLQGQEVTSLNHGADVSILKSEGLSRCTCCWDVLSTDRLFFSSFRHLSLSTGSKRDVRSVNTAWGHWTWPEVSERVLRSVNMTWGQWTHHPFAAGWIFWLSARRSWTLSLLSSAALYNRHSSDWLRPCPEAPPPCSGASVMKAHSDRPTCSQWENSMRAGLWWLMSLLLINTHCESRDDPTCTSSPSDMSAPGSDGPIRTQHSCADHSSATITFYIIKSHKIINNVLSLQ